MNLLIMTNMTRFMEAVRSDRIVSSRARTPALCKRRSKVQALAVIIQRRGGEVSALLESYLKDLYHGFRQRIEYDELCLTTA